jgi:N-acetylglutamate synthase-like GNAT family acetyltransferase
VFHHTPSGPGSSPFSERDFYLGEFRGRSIAIALERASADGLAQLSDVLAELAANETRVALLSPDRGLLEKLVADAVVVRGASPGGSEGDLRWVGGLWRRLRTGASAGLVVEGSDSFAAGCREVVDQLQLAKLVWIDSQGGLQRPDGARISYVDLVELEGIMAARHSDRPPPERVDQLREFHAMVAGGLPAVNVCSLEGLSEELFTYAGSGTLFTRERYTAVRRLSLDEFEAANHLIGRGFEEGYLAPRTTEEIDEILAHAFGVFIEGRYLAGLGALLPSRDESAGEVASLYTLTRFLSGGVGAHLVRFALQWAGDLGFDYAFACTTSERVVTFFERNGFQRVGPEGVAAVSGRSGLSGDAQPTSRRRHCRELRRSGG